MRSAVVVALLVTGLAGTAVAQPALTPPTPVPAPAPQQPTGNELSEGAALGLSLGGTAASWGLLLVAESSQHSVPIGTIGAIGTLVAPSFGHWYARSILTRGLGIRVLGVGLGFAGLVSAFHQIFDENGGSSDTASVLLVSGFVLYVGGTIDDIVTAPGKVRSYNEHLRNVSLVPVVHRDGGGVAIAGRF